MAFPLVTTPSNELASPIDTGLSPGLGTETLISPPCTTLTGVTSDAWQPSLLPSEQRDFISLSDDMPELLAVADDVDACTEAGVVVVNQSGGNTEAVAEHALAMMLTSSNASLRRIAKLGRAGDRPRHLYRPRTEGRTLGVLGIGNVAVRAKSAHFLT